MFQKLRNRKQIMKPSKINFYKLLPLILMTFLMVLTVFIGIADPTLNPPPPPPGAT